MNDNELRAEIEGLDTLAGGIVYGRKDAWEKLQGRMEQKPARRVAVYYWGAAATIALIICVAGTLIYTSKTTHTVAKTTQTPNTLPIEVSHTAIRIPLANTTGTPKAESAVEDKKNTVVSNNTSAKIAIIQQTVRQPEVQSSSARAIPLPAPQSTATIATQSVKTPMRIVHINELNNELPHQTDNQILANNLPTQAGNKLPVVHINEVVREEYELKKILQENRLSSGARPPLFRPIYERNVITEADNQYEPLRKQRQRFDYN